MKEFEKTLKQAGESTLVYLTVDGLSGQGGTSIPTIIHDVVRDALTDDIIHADFYKVNLAEKIKTSVPVTFIGESPAVTELKGIFVRNVNEMEVEALPQDLPHEISVDISVLKNFGDQVLLKDINLGPKIKLIGDDNEIVATVQEPMSEEELKAQLEAPTTDISAVELEKKEKEEGEGEEAEAPTEEGKTPAPAVEEKKGKKEEK
jgi:large subunit ribosomal protein L25